VPASPAVLHQSGWTAERTLAVSAGQPTTVHVFGRHEIGSDEAYCIGSFSAELLGEPLQ